MNFWNERHNKHVREGKVTDEERERDAVFYEEYLQGPTVNPRGVLTHLIPSAQYSTELERNIYEKALAEGV